MTQRRPPSERKVEILEAALNVFVRKGYAETRIDDIVDEIGLSKGAIYHHFAGKRELFKALIEHWMDQFIEVRENENLSGSPSADLIKRIARFTTKVFRRNPNWFLVEPEMWSYAYRDEEIRDLASQLYNKFLSEFESLIQRGIDYGEFKKVNARLIALSIMNSLHGIIWFMLFQPQDFSLEEYVDLNMNSILEHIQNS
jgi:AcrR family transcriptional regulator